MCLILPPVSFARSGLNVAQLSDPGAYFEQDSLSSLWSLARQESGDPAIGLKMGMNPSINAFDIYSSSIISGSCVRGALAPAVRHNLSWKSRIGHTG